MKKLTIVTPVSLGVLRKYILSYDDNGTSTETELISRRPINSIEDVKNPNQLPDTFNIMITTTSGKLVYLKKFCPTINDYCYKLFTAKCAGKNSDMIAKFIPYIIKYHTGLKMKSITSIGNTVYQDVSTSNMTTALIVVVCEDGKIRKSTENNQIICEDFDLTIKKVISGELQKTGSLDITFRLALDNLSMSAMINKLYHNYCTSMDSIIDGMIASKKEIDKMMGIPTGNDSEPEPMFGDNEEPFDEDNFCYEEEQE